MKLQNKSALLMFAFGCAFLIAISVIYYFHSRSFMLERSHRFLQIRAKEIAHNFTVLLKEKSKTTIAQSNAPVITQALTRSNSLFAALTEAERQQKIAELNKKWIESKDITDPFIKSYMSNSVANYLIKQQESVHGEYGEIFLTNRYGVIIATTNKLTTLAHAHKYWWIAAYNDGIGRIFFDDRGFDKSVKGYVLGVVVPIMKENQIIGVLKCNLNIIGALKHIMEDFKEENKGIVKLVRSGGLIVYEKGKVPLSTKVPSMLVEGMKKWATNSKVIQDNGIDKLVAYSPVDITHGTKEYGFGGSYKSIDHIKGNIGEGWFLVISRDLKEVLITSTAVTRWIIGIGSLFVLLIAVVAMLLSKKMSLPVIKLAHYAKKVGHGDFGTRIDVSSKDELGILADSFNKMVHNLGETTTSRDLLIKEIEQRKEVEDALRESEQRYRIVFNTSPDGMVISTLDGKILDVNQAFQDMLGYSLEEIKNLTFKQFTPEKWHKSEAEAIKVVLSETGHGTFEKEYIRKDGTIFPVSITGWVLRNKQGNPERLGAFVKNILETKRIEEEKKKLEAQLQHTQRMKAVGTLAGGIAHNFNNLLMGIQGNASLMLMEIDSNHPHHKKLKNIENQVRSGSKLTSQLVGYASEGRYEVKPFNLNKLVKETSDIFAAARKEIRVHQDLYKNLPGIKADQGQIEQVLLNLYVNAADAMPGGGDLFLKTTKANDKDITGKQYKPKPGNYVLLTARDTGVGMDRETMERIFEPFFTTKGLASSTGLGMASTYGIIKAHGGYIDVHSEKGKGTTFEIYLPATEEEIKEEKEVSGEIVKGKGTVLFVDDEDIVLDAGEQMLKYLGYEVLSVANGQEGLELYMKNHGEIDMVLLDMVMPGMGGGETYDRMKEANPNVKVLLSSGYSIEGEAKEILNRGCDGFIQKPFNLEQLAQKLKEILDKEKF